MGRKYVVKKTAYGELKKFISQCWYCDNLMIGKVACSVTGNTLSELDKQPKDCPLLEEVLLRL